jgi:phosphomannomutase
MNRIYIFDVDGTLTPSRLPMTKGFRKFFEGWILKNKFYLVTGSNIEKLQEQMCYFDIEAERIFTCCGNEMWKPDPHIVNISAELIYENKFKVSKKLKSLLEVILMSSPYPHRYGNHIEDRGSMVNFSIVGRDCNQLQREIFFEWDNQNKERKKISTVVKQKFPELDAVIGGQISIDIYPKGKDKSQILERIKSHINLDSHTKTYANTFEYIFIGDRTMKGGNDYPLAKLMEETDNCKYFQTEGWEQTMEILESLND